MTEIFVGVISVFIGFVSGLLTPLVRWQVDKRRERQVYRRDLVKTWRVAIDAEEFDLMDAQSNFAGTAVYSSLRANLMPEIIQKIEAPRTFYAGGSRGDHIRKQMLLDEVARLEKKWGIV